MADPTWVDSCTIADIAAGDTALEAELGARPSGLLMTPKVREEVLVGNPFKNANKKGSWETPLDAANACRAVIERMKIQTDYMGDEALRRQLFEKQFVSCGVSGGHGPGPLREGVRSLPFCAIHGVSDTADRPLHQILPIEPNGLCWMTEWMPAVCFLHSSGVRRCASGGTAAGGCASDEAVSLFRRRKGGSG
jgi:hypothetical protein